jgi:hypothetical protein
MDALINTIVAVGGLVVAAIALLISRQSNKDAREANNLAGKANSVAERALRLQEDEGRLRISVKPRMMCMLADGEDPKARPVVEVINLSSFPVTITGIHWKTQETEKPFRFWKNPLITAPFDKLPARLPPREALTALGTPTTFPTAADLLAVSAAVVITACGEQVDGMTDQWREHCDSVRKEAQLKPMPASNRTAGD